MEAKTCSSATSPFEAAFLSRRAGATGSRGFAYSPLRFARFEDWLSGSAAARHAMLELLTRRCSVGRIRPSTEGRTTCRDSTTMKIILIRARRGSVGCAGVEAKCTVGGRQVAERIRAGHPVACHRTDLRVDELAVRFPHD